MEKIDLTTFFKQMYKRAVEYMLEAELDAHLDNEKHEKTKEDISNMSILASNQKWDKMFISSHN